MKIDIASDEDTVARHAAAYIAERARQAVQARDRFNLAVSGGSTPWKMLRHLAQEEVPWDRVELFQVDERVASAGDLDRNLTHLRESLLSRVGLREEQMHAMPVEAADLAEAALRYGEELRACAGAPPVLDLAHLGLGPDGHTASLVPGDPALAVTDADVAVTGEYRGHRRMTLTYPVLDRARQLLWLVSGAEKAAMLQRLYDGDHAIPAGRVARGAAVILADAAAARLLRREA